MKALLVSLSVGLLAPMALAKLPAPDAAAKAKAGEAAAKAAWQGKVDGYQLCKAQDRVVAGYRKSDKGAAAAAAIPTPPCADPGPFVYAPPAQ